MKCFTDVQINIYFSLQVRSTSVGLKPYDSPTHSGYNIASIHNHANTVRTLGMGEVIAVLNGIEFRTRHNDYRSEKFFQT